MSFYFFFSPFNSFNSFTQICIHHTGYFTLGHICIHKYPSQDEVLGRTKVLATTLVKAWSRRPPPSQLHLTQTVGVDTAFPFFRDRGDSLDSAHDPHGVITEMPLRGIASISLEPLEEKISRQNGEHTNGQPSLVISSIPPFESRAGESALQGGAEPMPLPLHPAISVSNSSSPASMHRTHPVSSPRLKRLAAHSKAISPLASPLQSPVADVTSRELSVQREEERRVAKEKLNDEDGQSSPGTTENGSDDLRRSESPHGFSVTPPSVSA